MINRNSTVMWFKLLILVHIGTAFPLKCPEPSQWAHRANGHCVDPLKYFCLKNDLINGYSENCTRFDFQQAGRKAVLRGGIDADVCSAERYQPNTITFYTNVSTNCIFFKSFCNEEGQIVYDHGNRNTDTTCRCNYRQGYNFLIKPKKTCFCKPSQEDCSCYFKTCSNNSHILSPDYQCIYITDVNIVTQCQPITNEVDLGRRRPQILGYVPMKHNVSVPVQRNNFAALCLVLMCGLCIVIVLVVVFKTEIQRSLCRICCRVYYIDDSHDNITLYEGEPFSLRYPTFCRQRDIVIFKSGTVVCHESELNIHHVRIEDSGLYYAKCYCVRSKHTTLNVLRFFIQSPEPEIYLIEGEQLELQYELPKEGLQLCFFKNKTLIAQTERITKLSCGKLYTLTIKNVTLRDNGLYSAEEQNYGKSKVTEIKVRCFHIQSPGLEIQVIEGDDLSLRYTLPTDGLQLHFFKNDNFIAETERIKKHSDGRLNTLTITKVTHTDKGLYSAKVKNFISEITNLKVQSMFTSELNQTGCHEGDILQLKCSVYSENIDVKWLKNDIDIIQNENLSISKIGKNHMMTIQCAKMNDSGQYGIKVGNVQKQLLVAVQALFKRRLEKKTIMEGLEVTLECETEKAFPVVWYKDGREINPSSNIKLMTLKSTVHKLTILQTTLENKGKYEIKINNISSDADLDVKEMPDAIKQMSDHDRSVFLEAAKNGTKVRYNIRIIIVGKHGVGKTSLLRRLMKEDIEGVKSTDGINIEVKKCKINVNTKEWIFIKANESSSCEYPNDQYADCGFWDFAGQKEFYATHQTFLSRDAIYLLVVDVSENFENYTFERMIENPFDKTGGYIDFWLDNIHCYTVNDTDEYRTLEIDLLNPPVIIIGTGIDKVEDREKTKSSFETFINTLLLEHPKRKHLRNLCFLSNTEPSEDKMEFQTLREDIFDNASKIPKWGDNLPIRWIHFEEEIDRLINKGEFVISYDKAKSLAVIFSFSVDKETSELNSFLKYEHEIGNLIFFEDIKSYIILEPKWLVDVFRCFVAPLKFQSQSMNMPEWSRLETTGNLPDKLIDKLFSKVQMQNEHKAFALLIMEKFDIIVKPITTEKNEEYYMPCMIKASKFKEILNTFNVRNDKCSRTSWFGLQFDFLPPAFFNHILVTFLTKYSLCIVSKGRLAIYRGIGVFDLEASYCQKLVVCLSENSVAMQVWQFQNEEGICYQNERKYLTEIVDFLQQKYRIKIHYKCYLKCPDDPHDNTRGQMYLDDVSMKSQHYFHKMEVLRRFWFEDEEDATVDQKGNTPVKCHFCQKLPVNRCYECGHVLCKDCCLQNDTLHKYHTVQSINDKLLLTNKFSFPQMIVDMKILPGGLLVIAFHGSEILLTHSISNEERNEISVGGRPCGIAKLDQNTVVVLFSHRSEEVDSIEIVDIRQRQVVQHNEVKLYIPPRSFCPMLYIDDKLYINSQLGITMTNISGKYIGKIDLGFSPRDMCYDTKAASIYSIDDSGEKLICTERDEKTILVLPDHGFTNLKRLTIESEGDVLILCYENYEIKNFNVQRVSWDRNSSEAIITGKTNNKSPSGYKYSKICCDEESNSVVIGLGDTVYIYKTN